jgi:hypothetical protein
MVRKSLEKRWLIFTGIALLCARNWEPKPRCDRSVSIYFMVLPTDADFCR